MIYGSNEISSPTANSSSLTTSALTTTSRQTRSTTATKSNNNNTPPSTANNTATTERMQMDHSCQNDNNQHRRSNYYWQVETPTRLSLDGPPEGEEETKSERNLPSQPSPLLPTTTTQLSGALADSGSFRLRRLLSSPSWSSIPTTTGTSAVSFSEANCSVVESNNNDESNRIGAARNSVAVVAAESGATGGSENGLVRSKTSSGADAYLSYQDSLSFPCSHLRIPGTLYITNRAILFHTNVFLSFMVERRICLFLRDIVQMELFRTTSIRIQTRDGEVYVFKSFPNREQVLFQIHGVLRQQQTQSSLKQRQSQPQLASLPNSPDTTSSNTNHTGMNTVIPNFVLNVVNNDDEASDPQRQPQRRMFGRSQSASTSWACEDTNSTPTPLKQSPFMVSGVFAGGVGTTTLPSLPTAAMFFPNRRRACSDSLVRFPNHSEGKTKATTASAATTSLMNFRLEPMESSQEDILSVQSNSSCSSSRKLHEEDRRKTEAIKRGETENAAEVGVSNHTPLSVTTTNINQKEQFDTTNFTHSDDNMLRMVWEPLKQQTRLEHQLGEVGVESLILSNCSLEHYYQTFLVDDAPYSLEHYQTEYIKDKDVNLTKWEIVPVANTTNNIGNGDGDGNDDKNITEYSRTITFTHPIKNTQSNNSSSLMGGMIPQIGPSSALTCRSQRLRKLNDVGMILENQTVVQGIPGADCFYIQDLWIFEHTEHSSSQGNPEEQKQIRLSVHFDIKFKKRSIFRSIIQKNVRKETKEWINGYLQMVQTALQSSAVTAKVENQRIRSSMVSQVQHPQEEHYCGSKDMAVSSSPSPGSAAASVQKSNSENQSELNVLLKVLVEKLDQSNRIILILVGLIFFFQIVLYYQLWFMNQSLIETQRNTLQFLMLLQKQQ